tara:strand:+ start:70 stop:450 length:381 start_codon:yes stop_codon:yes gene_type:complete
MNTKKQFNKIAESSLFRLDGEKIDILDELQTLCECIEENSAAAEYEDEETNWGMGEGGECTLDELIIGAYWALTECHAGQESQSYAVMCSIGQIFQPGMTSGPEEESGEKTAYDLICADLLSKVSA